ncbi:MAG: SRPBCC family protein [Candidatus Melainabacteria bacterium]|nr:SRPBCC family protein [Candidatus Melainabacteria bacterium]
MPVIEVETSINASAEICFDLSRSIDLHLDSTADTGERAVSGVTSGLIGMNEEVTFRAHHIWWQELTSKIISFDRPTHFCDQMQQGFFQHFKHDHYFKESNGITKMTDEINFRSPFGPFGLLIDNLILKSYLTRFLKKRNELIKDIAESETKRSKYLI